MRPFFSIHAGKSFSKKIPRYGDMILRSVANPHSTQILFTGIGFFVLNFATFSLLICHALLAQRLTLNESVHQISFPIFTLALHKASNFFHKSLLNFS
jgi:hypothetical protein